MTSCLMSSGGLRYVWRAVMSYLQTYERIVSPVKGNASGKSVTGTKCIIVVLYDVSADQRSQIQNDPERENYSK